MYTVTFSNEELEEMKRKFPFVLFEEIYHQSSLHQRYLSHNRQYGVKLYDAIRS